MCALISLKCSLNFIMPSPSRARKWLHLKRQSVVHRKKRLQFWLVKMFTIILCMLVCANFGCFEFSQLHSRLLLLRSVCGAHPQTLLRLKLNYFPSMVHLHRANININDGIKTNGKLRIFASRQKSSQRLHLVHSKSNAFPLHFVN